MSSTFERIKSVMVEQMAFDEKCITEDADLRDDLGCDSIDLLGLEMAIEEEFSIDTMDASDGWGTMTDVVESVQAAIAARTLRLGETV